MRRRDVTKNDFRVFCTVLAHIVLDVLIDILIGLICYQNSNNCIGSFGRLRRWVKDYVCRKVVRIGGVTFPPTRLLYGESEALPIDNQGIKFIRGLSRITRKGCLY